MRLRLNAGAASIAVACVLGWEIASRTRLLDPVFFPAPTQLARSAWGMTVHGDLVRQTGATIFRTLVGFATGSLIGIACGLAMGSAARVRRCLEPFISAFYTTPKLSLFPILMLFFGIGELPKLVLIAAASAIILGLQTLDAVRNVSPTYVEMATNYGASRGDVLWRIYLPASLQSIFTGLRMALGRALLITIAVEMISSGDGLGGMLWWAWQVFAPDRLYVGVLASALVGLVFHKGLRVLETKIIPWSEENDVR